MNSIMKDKRKKPGPLKGLKKEERLKRYSVLFQWRNEEEFNPKALAKQWGCSVNGVIGMISAAKTSKKLYEDLRRLGYKDDEYPVWWWSPARVDDVSGRVDSVHERGGMSGVVETVSSRAEDVVLAPISPRSPADIESGQGRPSIQRQDDTIRDKATLDGSSRTETILTKDEIDLLASQHITEITPDRWMHTHERVDGSIILTPVNPQRELLNLKRSAQGDRIMGAVGEKMITSLSIHTQAIMKKIAFNPNVFQCWQYVSNAVDPDTGDPFISPDWDFGDFVSHCVLWTTENEYGVVPTILYNRPSRYTHYKEIMRPRNQGDPYSYDEYRGDKMPLSHLNLPRGWGARAEDPRE